MTVLSLFSGAQFNPQLIGQLQPRLAEEGKVGRVVVDVHNCQQRQ